MYGTAAEDIINRKVVKLMNISNLGAMEIDKVESDLKNTLNNTMNNTLKKKSIYHNDSYHNIKNNRSNSIRRIKQGGQNIMNQKPSMKTLQTGKLKLINVNSQERGNYSVIYILG